MKQQLAEMRTLKPAVRAALGLLAAGLALSVVLLSPSRSGNSVAAAWSQCRPRLIAYQPSEWEREWCAASCRPGRRGPPACRLQPY